MNVRIPTLNLIGAGRVGQTLARLWTQAGVFVVQDVLTTSTASAQWACEFIGAGTPAQSLRTMRSADVWLIATTDAQIAASAAGLAEQTGHKTDALAPEQAPTAAQQARATPTVFHCSGALPASVLSPLAALGWHVASAHPILSFATAQDACVQFAGTPCALEGDASARVLLQTAFTAIGAQCFEVRSQDKLLYHAAAVFATNFLPVLQSVAEDAWRATGVPEALLPHLRASLLHNAVANITRLGPQGALTGPAARGDTQAITRQAAAVDAWDEKSGAAYAALSTLALRLAGHMPSAAAAEASELAPPSPGTSGAALL
ncbi:MAG: DUF2520 domain-containing protein [Rhodoferax sp.]|nr:DUF2520 domain-containing protein [Rhodoferax sp.]